MKTLSIRVLGFALLVLSPGLWGCEFLAKKATEKAIESATGNAVSFDGKKVEIKSDEGEAVYKQDGDEVTLDGPKGKMVISGAKDGELPKDFPLPVQAKTTVLRTASMDADKGGTMRTAVLKSEADPKAVADFYVKHLEAEGFEVKRTETKAGPMNMVLVAAEKGGIQVGAQIMAGIGDPGTMVNLSWVEKKREK